MTIFHIVPWVFVAAGVILVVVGVRLFGENRRSASWPPIPGRIVGHQTRPGSEVGDPDLLAAVIEYRLPGGPLATLVDSVATNRPEPVGKTIELRYDPTDPGTVRRWRPVMGGCLAAGAVGLGLACIAGGLFGGWLSLG